MIFALTDPTACVLSTCTNRIERHGEEDVPAVSFGLTFTTANTILDRLSETLRHALYERANDHPQLEGIEEATTKLRSSSITSVAVAGCFEGWALKIDHGIDEHEPITFGAVKVDKFKVAPSEGGTVTLSLRCSTSDIDAERLGVVAMKLGQEIVVTIAPPDAGGA